MRDLTVEQTYGIDSDSLHMLSETNGYWDKSFNFYDKMKGVLDSDLSYKQREWLEKIAEDYEEAYEKIS